MGQFQGFRNKLDVHLRREYQEPPVNDVELFYNNFLSITLDPVFKVIEFYLFYLFEYRKENGNY
jgi:hypothetical protein